MSVSLRRPISDYNLKNYEILRYGCSDTNYGVAISYSLGIFRRALKPYSNLSGLKSSRTDFNISAASGWQQGYRVYLFPGNVLSLSCFGCGVTQQNQLDVYNFDEVP